MPRDEDVIDNAVVKVTPDLTGFKRSLESQLKTQMAGVTPSIKVKLVADKTGFHQSVRDELKKVSSTHAFKVKLVADKTGFAQSVRDELKKVSTPEFKVRLVADSRGFARSVRDVLKKENLAVGVRGKGGGGGGDRETAAADRKAEKARKALYSRMQDISEVVQRDELKSYETNFKRLRVIEEWYQKQEIDAWNIHNKMKRDVADKAVADEEAKQAALTAEADRAAKERTKIAEREGKEQSRAAERAEVDRRKRLNRQFDAPKLIDFGGEGVRPMNLLYGAVTALTPALFAMGSSAVQASTSVAALGAAGIGTALSLSGLVVAFQSISEVLSLRKQVMNEGLLAGAKKDAGETANAFRDLANAQRDEKAAYAAVHTARQEAVRDLEDLRHAVRDLDNEYKSNNLSVREAEEAERATNRNFFASALDRARAHQDTLDARTKLQDTRLERRQKTQDLARSLKSGIEGSDKVLRAKETARDARDRRLDVQSRKTSGAAGGVSSASAQLAQKLRDLSPAARDMYNWFVKSEDLFKNLGRTIQQGVLPGFTRFLEAVTATPKGGKSTLQVAAEYAAQLGGIIGKYAGKLGEWSKSPLFREKMATIQGNNVKAFDNLGKAGITVLRPLLRIFAAASPLLVKFSEKLLDLAKAFDRWIEAAENSGGLGKWFKDAATQAQNWWKVIKSVGTILKDLFTASVGTGGSLVERLGSFIDGIAKWTSSDEGQKKLTEFFNIFKNLPYAQIGKLLAGFTELFLMKHAAQWAATNPFFAAMGVLATSNPAAAASFLTLVSRTGEVLAATIGRNPEITAFILGLVTLARLNKATGGILLKIPGIDGLKNTITSKFKFLEKFTDGATTGTMNVRAAVVNIYGGAAGGPPGGAVPGGTPTGPGGTVKKKPGKLAAGTGGNLALSAGLGVGAALVGMIDTEGATPFAKGVQSAVQGTLNGAALGLMVGGPIGAALGGAIGAAVASWQIKQEQLSTAMGREKFFHDRIGQDVNQAKQYKNRVPLTLGNISKREALQSYITNRQQSVDTAVEAKKAAEGDKAAAQLRIDETRKSATELSRIVQLYGVGKEQADSWARATTGLDKLIYDQNIAAKNAMDDTINRLDGAGKAAHKTGDDVKYLSEQIDTLSGERVIILTVDGKQTVIDDLENIALYQQLIRQGKAPTTANVNEQKRVFQKALQYGMAAGGEVNGYSPNPTADNIPAMLTAGEYVQPVASVKHYGPEFMEAVRTRRFPGYAKGGTVQRWKFPVKVPPEAATAVTGPDYAGPGGGVPTGSVGVAETAEATARAMGATSKQLVALIEAGLVESGMRNIDYGDRDSVGFLQQRPSQGWGSVKQLMDPAYATRKFINAAKRIDNADWSAGTLAANVQRPARQYRGRYATREADAVAIINRNLPFLTNTAGGSTVGGNGTKSGLIAFGRWLQQRGYTVTENPAFGGVGRHGSRSQHYRGNAIDVNHGAGTSAAEQAYLRRIIPEGHRRGFHSIFMSPGHYNHAHFDLGPGHANGGLVKKFDAGGILPPGYTLAFNGTGRNETVRTDRQERQIQSGPVRLDRRDVALLAGAIAGTGQAAINMDGRKVAELTNRYNYLSSGV